MTIERRGDTVVYTDETGRQKPARLFVAVGPDGQPTGSVQINSRTVRVLNGVSINGAEQIVPEDPNRTGLTIRNDDDTKMYFNIGAEAGNGIGYPMEAGRGYSFEALGMIPSDYISVWCAVAGKKWAALYATTSPPYGS